MLRLLLLSKGLLMSDGKHWHNVHTCLQESLESQENRILFSSLFLIPIQRAKHAVVSSPFLWPDDPENVMSLVYRERIFTERD